MMEMLLVQHEHASRWTFLNVCLTVVKMLCRIEVLYILL